jgi:hypothetical protein
MMDAVTALFSESSGDALGSDTTPEQSSTQCCSNSLYESVLAGDIFVGLSRAHAIDSSNCLAPLRIRAAIEAHAKTSDADFEREVEAVQHHEQIRRATADRTANEMHFPLPDLANRWHVYVGNALWLMYDKVGTWDVSALSASEALAARRAIPFNNCSPPTPPERLMTVFDSDSEDEDEFAALTWEQIEVRETAEWHHIASAKEAERDVWGNFDTAHFPLGHRVWRDDDPKDLHPSDLRTAIHSDNTGFRTSIDGDAAWEVKAKTLLPQIPKNVWEFNATGGFCLREASVTSGFNQTEPSDDWECVICLGESRKGVVAIGCAHMFHEGCITRWLGRSKRCPLCRAKCHDCPPCCNPPMDFELTPWRMLPEGVITGDDCTESQAQVAAARSRRQLSAEAIESRRERLAKRFNCEPPSAAFFEERRADDTALIGPDAVATRSQQFRKEVAAECARLQLLGQQLVVWPVDRRWPLTVETDPRIIDQRNQIQNRLDTRYWRRQCRSNKGLAKYLLKQCYSLSFEA